MSSGTSRSRDQRSATGRIVSANREPSTQAITRSMLASSSPFGPTRSTGRSCRRRTASATLPSTISPIRPRPCDAITRSVSGSSATSAIAAAGSGSTNTATSEGMPGGRSRSDGGGTTVSGINFAPVRRATCSAMPSARSASADPSRGTTTSSIRDGALTPGLSTRFVSVIPLLLSAPVGGATWHHSPCWPGPYAVDKADRHVVRGLSPHGPTGRSRPVPGPRPGSRPHPAGPSPRPARGGRSCRRIAPPPGVR